MYGHEVPRPAWFKARRKYNWHAILNRAPSWRRQMILEDILAGLSYRQIALKQGIARSTVSMSAATLYKQHRVKGPDALRKLLGPSEQRQAA
jgi:DNA-binding NarL/FixJ family response regulator